MDAPDEPAVVDERRAYERVLMPLTNGAVAAMLPSASGRRVYSSVWNLSLGGACLLLPRGGGDDLVAEGLGVFSDGDGNSNDLAFRVIWVESLGLSYFVGVAFEAVPLPPATILESFVTR